MAGKKLPKSIRPTAAKRSQAAVEPAATAHDDGPATAERSENEAAGPPSSTVKADRPKSKERNIAARAAPPLAESLRDPADDMAVRRRALAYRTVERYAAFAAGGGIVPLPAANIAIVMGVNIRMVKVLSDIYGVPFHRDSTRSMVIGLIAGAAPTGLAAATASMLYLIPAGTLVAVAVSSAAAVACTRHVGRVFVDLFENPDRPR